MCVRCSCKDIIEQQFEKSKAHSVEFSAKAAARRKPPCCRVWMSLQQLFLLQFLYAAGFVGIAVSFLHSGASRVLLVQVVPLVEYLRGAGTFLLVFFKRFCFFRPLGKEGIKLKYQIIPTGRGGNLLCWSFFENRVVKLSRRRPRCMHANKNNLVQSEQSRLNGADNQTLNR